MRTSKYFPALDGMRGVAAVLALLHHVALYFSLDTGMLRIPFLHDHLYLLVDCFFIMSGFVIAHSFDAKMDGGMSFWRFMWFRVLRLYPMIIVGVLFGAVTILAYWRTEPQIAVFRIAWSIVSGLFLLPTSVLLEFKPFAFPANSPHWSLSFEMILCVLYAGLCARASYRALWVYTLVAAVGLVGAAWVAGSLDIGFFWRDYGLTLGRVVFPFLIGIVLRRSDFFRPEATKWGYAAIPLLCLVLWNPIPASWEYDAITDLAVLPAIVWLIASAAPSKMFDPMASLGGEISYPLYAIHYPFVIAFANASKILHFGELTNLLTAILCCLVVLVLAALCYSYLDVPIRRSLGRLFRSDGPRVAKAA
jgi:peptidoglycan/LPS O-acetylase OafA/YrhL